MSNTIINNNSTLYAKLSSPAACISIQFAIKICAASIDLTLTKKANHHGVTVLKCSTIKVTYQTKRLEHMSVLHHQDLCLTDIKAY